MASFVVRVGDQDDYHLEDEIVDVAERLRMHRVVGPLSPCMGGVEAEGYRRRNYISLFASDGGSFECGGFLTSDQIAELNGLLS